MVLVSSGCMHTLMNMPVPHMCIPLYWQEFENASALNICDCAGDRGCSVCRKMCMIPRMTVSFMEILCVCSFCGM